MEAMQITQEGELPMENGQVGLNLLKENSLQTDTNSRRKEQIFENKDIQEEKSRKKVLINIISDFIIKEKSSVISNIDIHDSEATLIVENIIKPKKNVFQSDSDSEDIIDKKAKRSRIIDSDSEDEETVKNVDIKDLQETSNNDLEIDNKKELLESDNLHYKSKLYNLCDSESSDDESKDATRTHKILSDESDKDESPEAETTKKEKKMTGKDALELRRQIKSESQRMVRERKIFIPYHKPKQFTLKEFLTRRPKLASAISLPSNVPASVAIKMSAEELEKKFKERKKEVEAFYKSESESDDDNKHDEDYQPLNDKMSQNNNPTENELLLEKGIDKGKSTKISTETLTDTPESNDFIDLDNDNNSNDKQTTVADTVVQFDQLESFEASTSTKIDSHKTSVDSYKLSTSQSQSILNKSDEKVKETNSMEYEFNLDDMDEFTEKINVESEPNRKEFKYTELDEQIENFVPEMEKVAGPKMVDLVKEQVGKFRPKLSGNPDDVIDLDTGVMEQNEISKLKNRFVKHTFHKHNHKHKIQLSIVSVEHGEIHKETVAMNVDDEDDAAEIHEKPGARLKKLRNELQNQMNKKRTELWQQKTLQKDALQESEEQEKKACEADNYDDDYLDDEEEEFEMTESESEEDEDENEEINKENKKKTTKSPFVENEAEESGLEDENDEENCLNDMQNDEDEAEGDKNEEDDKESFIEDADFESEENKTDAKEDNDSKNLSRKTMRRIIKGFTEDSDEDEDFDKSLSLNGETLMKNNKINTINCDDDLPTPNQLQSTEINKENIGGKYKTDISTPLKSIDASQLQFGNEPSPLKEINWQQNLKEKLMITESLTQIDKIDLAQKLTQNETSFKQNTQISPNSHLKMTADSQTKLMTSPDVPSSQDLLNVCSGVFTGITQVVNSSKPTNEPPKCFYDAKEIKEVKSLDEEHNLTLISQILDEEEMEKYKKKFESPLYTNTQKRIVEEFMDCNEVEGTGELIDSDDEDEGGSGIRKKKKKGQRKLQFSDEESSDDENYKAGEEVINLHDEIDSEDEIKSSNIVELDDVAYDSEENEIEIQNDEALKLKASDFFENEAELSESDWGSADEDEKDLDDLEFENGDDEKFDEKKMKTDLERIHMRRILDDDTREVKILQEMFLEDGELHGNGRVRQFKWKNTDSNAFDENERKEEEDDRYDDEEESEEAWRKKRYEREMFLKEQREKNNTMEDDLENSKLLKIGKKMINQSVKMKIATTVQSMESQSVVNKEKIEIVSEVKQQSFSLLVNKRGSFLNRPAHVLKKLAEYNKVSSAAVGQKAKNSKNFVFQTLSSQDVSTAQDKKRKATEGTPIAVKKLRLTDNFSPLEKSSKIKEKKSKRGNFFVNNNW